MNWFKWQLGLARRHENFAQSAGLLSASTSFQGIKGGSCCWWHSEEHVWRYSDRHCLKTLPFVSIAAGCAPKNAPAWRGWSGAVPGSLRTTHGLAQNWEIRKTYAFHVILAQSTFSILTFESVVIQLRARRWWTRQDSGRSPAP